MKLWKFLTSFCSVWTLDFLRILRRELFELADVWPMREAQSRQRKQGWAQKISTPGGFLSWPATPQKASTWLRALRGSKQWWLTIPSFQQMRMCRIFLDTDLLWSLANLQLRGMKIQVTVCFVLMVVSDHNFHADDIQSESSQEATVNTVLHVYS